jgi:6-phosphogluconolactonase
MNGRPHIYSTLDGLIRASAEQIAALLIQGVRARGSTTIALSGGSTPGRVYALLGSDPFRAGIPWESVHVFWGDERCVPPESLESNYRMASEALLGHITIPPQNVHRIRAEQSPSSAAEDYEKEIRRTFELVDVPLPRFDIILLGLGDDGHTASLFPGTSALNERRKLVADTYVEKLRAHRITLTLPVINNASHILFLVSGKGKAKTLHDVLQGDRLLFPAQYVRPSAGELLWMVDQDAASQLETVHQQ